MSGVLSLLVARGGSAAGGGFTVTAPNITAQQPAGTPVSGSSTATPTGGTAPYTYSWAASGTGISYSGTATDTLTA